jgi:ATP phosphoribosyltransferase
MKTLRLGVPKGSLQDTTVKLFRNAGWQIKVSERSYFPTIDDDSIDCSLIRAQEMARYVEHGTLDAGITGKDWMLENDSKVHTVCDLVYRRPSFRPTRWILAVPEDSPVREREGPARLSHRHRAGQLTRRYLKNLGVPVEVEFSWGATEVKPPEDSPTPSSRSPRPAARSCANRLRIVTWCSRARRASSRIRPRRRTRGSATRWTACSCCCAPRSPRSTGWG